MNAAGRSQPIDPKRSRDVVDRRLGDGSIELAAAAEKARRIEMEAEGLARLRASPGSGSGAGLDGAVRTERSVDMRYGEQVFEITVSLGGVDWRVPDPLPQIVERFHARHDELYTYSMPDQETVLVNARVAVAGILSALPQEPTLPEGPATGPRSERRIYLDDWVTAPVWDFDALAPAQRIAGPAIVVSAMTTILLRRGEHAIVTRLGWLDIAIGNSPCSSTERRGGRCRIPMMWRSGTRSIATQ